MRQLDGEGRALLRARALRAHVAAVELDQVLDERQTHAEPAVRARGRAIRLTEALEQVRQGLAADPAPLSITWIRASTPARSRRTSTGRPPA